MKHVRLWMNIVIFILITTNAFSFNLNEDYGRGVYAICASFPGGRNKDALCLDNDTNLRLINNSGTDGWYFTRVKNKEGKILGYAITQDKPSPKNARTYVKVETKDDGHRHPFRFINIEPGQPVPNEAIFVFTPIGDPKKGGAPVFSIKNYKTKEYLVPKVKPDSPYSHRVELSPSNRDSRWTLNSIPKEGSKFYKNYKSKDKNSVANYTFRITNPKTQKVLTGHEDEQRSYCKVIMDESIPVDDEQLWQIIPVKGFRDCYLIKNVGNGHYLMGKPNGKYSADCYLNHTPICMTRLFVNQETGTIRLKVFSMGRYQSIHNDEGNSTFELIRYEL